jgi:hypothetical protein
MGALVSIAEGWHDGGGHMFFRFGEMGSFKVMVSKEMLNANKSGINTDLGPKVSILLQRSTPIAAFLLVVPTNIQ